MNCPNCETKRIAIYDSRHTQHDVMRKRKCLSCDFRFYTIERYMTVEELEEIQEEKYQERLHAKS